MMPLTPWVKRLLLANVVMFLITMANPVLYRALILYPPWALLRPWTLITYMFLHGGFGHLGEALFGEAMMGLHGANG